MTTFVIFLITSDALPKIYLVEVEIETQMKLTEVPDNVFICQTILERLEIIQEVINKKDEVTFKMRCFIVHTTVLEIDHVVVYIISFVSI